MILQAKGDLDGAHKQTERALRIEQRVYGPDHPKVSIVANNLGMILLAQGDTGGRRSNSSGRYKSTRRCTGRSTRTWRFAVAIWGGF
jgi:hypothetical protein